MALKKISLDKELLTYRPSLVKLGALYLDDPAAQAITAYGELLSDYKDKISYLESELTATFSAFSLGDAIDDGICVADSEGRILAANNSYTRITGIEESEILGRNVEALMKEGYFSAAASMDVIKSHKRISAMSTIARSGKRVLITGVPILDGEGRLTCVMTVMRDISELLNLKEELELASRENIRYQEELNRLKESRSGSILGENSGILRLQQLISYVAKTDVTVLIEAETGCGKELVSDEIQRQSERRDKPYIKVNCAAIPDTLLESELFGYESGAFTGARSKGKPGMFELADGGTILLDEIGEMPLAVQSKLLRVLQEKELQRLGGSKAIKVDVRVIASTNRDLLALKNAGKFREDLYYRLNVIPISIVPLRERKSDIPLLANAFLDRYNKKYGKNKRFGSGAIYELSQHDWPGNVRELQNTIERLIVINDNIYITASGISEVLAMEKRAAPETPPSPAEAFGGMSLGEATEKLQRELIEKALSQHGSTYKAAAALGVSQPTLFRKARSLGLMGNRQD